jgi:hypothetical protein
MQKSTKDVPEAILSSGKITSPSYIIYHASISGICYLIEFFRILKVQSALQLVFFELTKKYCISLDGIQCSEDGASIIKRTVILLENVCQYLHI